MARLLVADIEGGGFAFVETFAARDQHLVAGQLVDQADREIAIPEHLDELIGGERRTSEAHYSRHLRDRNMRIVLRREVDFGANWNRTLEISAGLVLGDSGGQRFGIVRRP